MIVLSDALGFCGGVRRAVNLAKELVCSSDGTVYSDGELVHNKFVLNRLKNVGLKIFEDKIPKNVTNKDVVLTRAHGTSDARRAMLSEMFNTVIDGTCPHVSNMISNIKKHVDNGTFIIIAGNINHPEISALTNDISPEKFAVVKSMEDIEVLQINSKNILFMAQSTFNELEFKNLSNKVKKLFPHAEIFDSICKSSKIRQTSVYNLKDNGAQAIIVVGDHSSNNTKSLVKASEKLNLPTFHVESVDDLHKYNLKTFHTVGVVSGTSTGQEEIDDVVAFLKSL